MAPSQTALRSPVYHFYYTHLHFHISYLHFLCRYKSDGLWLIRPLCSELASVRTPRRTGAGRSRGAGREVTAYRTPPPSTHGGIKNTRNLCRLTYTTRYTSLHVFSVRHHLYESRAINALLDLNFEYTYKLTVTVQNLVFRFVSFLP